MRNTMGSGEYLKGTVFWVLISMLWYKNLLFRCIGECSYKESKLILWGMLAIFVIIGNGLSYRHARCGFSIIINIAFPFGVYTVLAYSKIRGTLIVIVLGFVLAASVFYSIVILSRKIRAGHSAARIKILKKEFTDAYRM